MNDEQESTQPEEAGNGQSKTSGSAARKRRIVILLLVYAAIFGVYSGVFAHVPQMLDSLVSLPFLVLGVAWCFVDAAERGYRIGLISRLLLIFLFVVGFVNYLVRTRGVGAIRTLALAMVLIGASLGISVLFSFATQYFGPAAGLWESEYYEVLN